MDLAYDEAGAGLPVLDGQAASLTLTPTLTLTLTLTSAGRAGSFTTPRASLTPSSDPDPGSDPDP